MIWRDPIFAGIPLRVLVWWRVSGIVRRAFWRAAGLLLPLCPECHQRVDGPIRMTPYDRCVECDERLWDLHRDFGDRPW